MLRGLDALVFDIQDVGARFYTYETTMAYAMEAAAKAGIPFYVLDRPNPITGMHVEGPLLDAANKSFIGYLPGLPVRHGMTIGELARLFNGENKIGANLTVIPMQDWDRGDWFDPTGLPWVNPSPNMRSLNAARAVSRPVPAGILARTIGGPRHRRALRTGRRRFHQRPRVGGYLNARQIPGVRVYPTSFTPTESNFKGVRIEGVRFVITNRELFDSTRLGLEVAGAHPKALPRQDRLRRAPPADRQQRRDSPAPGGEDPRASRRAYTRRLERIRTTTRRNTCSIP